MNGVDPPEHFLFPPADKDLRKRLEIKLEEYKKRKEGEGRPWEFLEARWAFKLFPDYRDACLKADVLSALLASDKPLDTWRLCQKLCQIYREDFDRELFMNACAVIVYYLAGNAESGTIADGTGLPDSGTENA